MFCFIHISLFSLKLKSEGNRKSSEVELDMARSKLEYLVVIFEIHSCCCFPLSSPTQFRAAPSFLLSPAIIRSRASWCAPGHLQGQRKLLQRKRTKPCHQKKKNNRKIPHTEDNSSFQSVRIIAQMPKISKKYF